MRATITQEFCDYFAAFNPTNNRTTWIDLTNQLLDNVNWEVSVNIDPIDESNANVHIDFVKKDDSTKLLTYNTVYPIDNGDIEENKLAYDILHLVKKNKGLWKRPRTKKSRVK